MIECRNNRHCIFSNNDLFLGCLPCIHIPGDKDYRRFLDIFDTHRVLEVRKLLSKIRCQKLIFRSSSFGEYR